MTADSQCEWKSWKSRLYRITGTNSLLHYTVNKKKSLLRLLLSNFELIKYIKNEDTKVILINILSNKYVLVHN